MSRSFIAVLFVLLFGGAALAGCISPSDVQPAAAVDPTASAATGATGAVVYAPPPAGVFVPEDAAERTLLPVDPAMILPVGAMRVSPLSSFEPTLGVDSKGNIYLSTFAGATGTRVLLQRSSDQGATWEDATPQIASGSFPPQSNDPYVYVDMETDRIFLSDLQALVCSTLSMSDDGAKTWTSTPAGCGLPVGVQDHQTVFTAKSRGTPTVGYDKLVYYCINRVADSVCATSVNGGITFGPLVKVYSGLSDVNPENPAAPQLCGGLHAHGAASHDGKAYLPKGHCGVPMVAISEDDGLTWDLIVISHSVPAAGHEVAFALDEVGNAYAFWIGPERLPYLAVSADGGRTWNEPIMVAPPGVMTTDFPTIAAGADGRVVMAYYGTANAKPYNEMDNTDTWNGYMTVITNALDEQPILQTVTVNDPANPIARGVCGGSRCNGVGDFIDVVIGPDGRPWAAFVDVCNEKCELEGADGNFGSFGFVGTFAEGPSLRGDLVALPVLPVKLS